MARPTLPPIAGPPWSVRTGSYGEPGNLIARIETDPAGGVIYRIDAIVLKDYPQGGNAAAIALARAGHREMIRRAAIEAKTAGHAHFRLRGMQANANFRAHADRLARQIGVAGSGHSPGGVGGAHPDYEVTLDVAKVLAMP
jgi:hypothetical protein